MKLNYFHRAKRYKSRPGKPVYQISSPLFEKLSMKTKNMKIQEDMKILIHYKILKYVK
jgi:hypothetical protein